VPCCQKYTPPDCFFGDVAHWVILTILLFYFIIGNNEITNLQRPFDFTMKVLSGLAFRQNEASRYIPVYIKEYKQIFSHIPPFLCASKLCGFQVPDKLKDLIRYVKQISETSQDPEAKDKKEKLEFFVQKLKSQAKTMYGDTHKNCYKQQCCQVRNLNPLTAKDFFKMMVFRLRHDSI